MQKKRRLLYAHTMFSEKVCDICKEPGLDYKDPLDLKVQMWMIWKLLPEAKQKQDLDSLVTLKANLDNPNHYVEYEWKRQMQEHISLNRKVELLETLSELLAAEKNKEQYEEKKARLLGDSPRYLALVHSGGDLKTKVRYIFPMTEKIPQHYAFLHVMSEIHETQCDETQTQWMVEDLKKEAEEHLLSIFHDQIDNGRNHLSSVPTYLPREYTLEENSSKEDSIRAIRWHGGFWNGEEFSPRRLRHICGECCLKLPRVGMYVNVAEEEIFKSPQEYPEFSDLMLFHQEPDLFSIYCKRLCGK